MKWTKSKKVSSASFRWTYCDIISTISFVCLTSSMISSLYLGIFSSLSLKLFQINIHIYIIRRILHKSFFNVKIFILSLYDISIILLSNLLMIFAQFTHSFDVFLSITSSGLYFILCSKLDQNPLPLFLFVLLLLHILFVATKQQVFLILYDKLNIHFFGICHIIFFFIVRTPGNFCSKFLIEKISFLMNILF